MERLHREVNRLFSDTFASSGGSTAPSYPAMNVWTQEEGAVVTAELPGLTAADIEITVVGDTLTLSGNRAANEVPEGAKYHRRERNFGKFNRVFQLPFNVEVDQVQAVFKNGVLHLSLPRAEAEKPKKIAIKAA
jgi:HSP20 family protein